MFSVGHADFFCFCPVPGRDQVTVIGESCSEKGPAVDIVRTYLQAQTAFQALCRAVLMKMIQPKVPNQDNRQKCQNKYV